MKSAQILLVILFLGSLFYFGMNKFEVPKTFLFQKTENVTGIVTDVKNITGIRGYIYELTSYEYIVSDSIYLDSFKAGQREGHQEVGDKLLIKYSLSYPAKNEVIGFYRDSDKRNKKPMKASSIN